MWSLAYKVVKTFCANYGGLQYNDAEHQVPDFNSFFTSSFSLYIRIDYVKIILGQEFGYNM